MTDKRSPRTAPPTTPLDLLVAEVHALSQMTFISTAQEQTLAALLHAAIIKGPYTLRHLLWQGIDPNAKVKGITALYFACMHGQEIAIDALLVHGATAHLKNDDCGKQLSSGATPLHAIAFRGAIPLFKEFNIRTEGLLLDAPDSCGRTPLLHALIGKQAQMAYYLLSKGANPAQKDSLGNRASILAVRQGFYDVVLQLFAKNPGVIEETDEYGHSLLYNAAKVPHPALLEFLVQKSTAQQLNVSQRTCPLAAAIKAALLENVQILVRAGACLEPLHGHGVFSARDYAVSWLNNGLFEVAGTRLAIVEFLEKYPAKRSAMSKKTKWKPNA